jgi:hypothetical protein
MPEIAVYANAILNRMFEGVIEIVVDQKLHIEGGWDIMIRDPIGVKVRRGVDPMQWFMMVAAYGGSEEKKRKAID